MHYLFERRLNMLEIEVHDLKDDALADFGLQARLQNDYSIDIPVLNTDGAKEEIDDKEVLPEEGPEGFRLREKTKVYYYRCRAPFSSKAFISDLLPMVTKEEGLSISEEAATYTEFSHVPLEKDTRERLALWARAQKAFADVSLTLDEFAANAVEFNQLILPAAVLEKIQAERLLRFERQVRLREGKPAYS